MARKAIKSQESRFTKKAYKTKAYLIPLLNNAEVNLGVTSP